MLSIQEWISHGFLATPPNPLVQALEYHQSLRCGSGDDNSLLSGRCWREPGKCFLLIGFAPSEALLVSFSSLWTTLLVPSCTCYCGLVPFSAHTLIGAAQQNNEYQRAWWQQMKAMTESQDLLGFLSLSWAMSLARPAPILANNRPLALVVDLRQVTKMEDKI